MKSALIVAGLVLAQTSLASAASRYNCYGPILNGQRVQSQVEVTQQTVSVDGELARVDRSARPAAGNMVRFNFDSGASSRHHDARAVLVSIDLLGRAEMGYLTLVSRDEGDRQREYACFLQ